MTSDSLSDPKVEIAHVLTMDVVGYSNLLITEQSALVAELTRIVRGTARFQEAEAEGKLLRIPTGDGMALVFFDDPQAPIECAVEIARALRAQPQIKLRMGIHSGPVNEVIDVNDRANIAGAGIDMAQRVMDCGGAGHILLTKRVADDLAPFPRWNPHLHELGEVEVKHGRKLGVVNFYTEEIGNSEMPAKCRAGAAEASSQRAPRPGWKSAAIAAVALLLLAAAVMLGWRFSRSAAPARPQAAAIPEKSIAVLPFENRSEDKANAYFADGVQDEILTRLSKIADLKVISRTSTQHYKSAPENVPEIGRQLGVAHVVEGSVQKSGTAVRINVQLIRTADDSHLWAETFDRELTDIFSVETEVAKTIADFLKAKITGAEAEVLAAKPTSNPEAYDNYLRGLAFASKTTPTPVNMLGAQKHFHEATRLDPGFALAWALLSIIDSRGYLAGSLPPTPALREEARQAAEKAIELQPKLGEAILARAHYHYSCLRDYERAERYLTEARPFLPNSSRVLELQAFITRRRGQWDRSEAYLTEAERLDPRNVNLLTQCGFTHLARRNFSEALRKFDQVLAITANDMDTLANKACVAQAQGDLAQAAALLAPLRPSAEDFRTLEIQVYQSLIERRPARMIARLQEILAEPQPSLGYLNGELRVLLGFAHYVGGDEAAARAAWEEARRELEGFLADQPENRRLLDFLAVACAGLGDKTAAFAYVERAIALLPLEKDALHGPANLEILAWVAAQTGESARAVATLEKLMTLPYEGMLQRAPLTPALLRLDPRFDALRNDPQFQKLAAGTDL